MAELNSASKPFFEEEMVPSKPDSHDPLIGKGRRHDRHLQHARRPLSMSAMMGLLCDAFMILPPVYSLTFACLAYLHRGEPVENVMSRRLLEAAKYGATFFPIIFAAVVASCLRSFAAMKVERGVSILTIEQLLGARTVFKAITVPFMLRAANLTTVLLVFLWSLSPVGSQAALRVLSTEYTSHNTTGNLTYLAFNSGFPNAGVGSTSAQLLGPSNAVFAASLSTTIEMKQSPQDMYGNIKIPMYESLNPQPASALGEAWREVPNKNDAVVWSSLAGLPVTNLPLSGSTTFSMSTGYMAVDCEVIGKPYPTNFTPAFDQYFWMGMPWNSSNMLWSGGNFGIAGTGSCGPTTPCNVLFESLATLTTTYGVETENKAITSANCTVNMHYVDVNINCQGRSCRATAIRPSTEPARHLPSWGSVGDQYLNLTGNTPLNGLPLGDSAVSYMKFWDDFVNAIDVHMTCDAAVCPPSAIEGYPADPTQIYPDINGRFIWKIGQELFSRRMSQLINTYWVRSIAPYVITGSFNGSMNSSLPQDGYNTDSTIGQTTLQTTVLRCDGAWFVVLLVASLVMVSASIISAVLNLCREGPDVLGSFSMSLRDSSYVDFPRGSSLEDSLDMSRRLGKVKLRLGDVRPHEDVGYVALATAGDIGSVQKMKARRLYA